MNDRFYALRWEQDVRPANEFKRTRAGTSRHVAQEPPPCFDFHCSPYSDFGSGPPRRQVPLSGHRFAPGHVRRACHTEKLGNALPCSWWDLVEQHATEQVRRCLFRIQDAVRRKTQTTHSSASPGRNVTLWTSSAWKSWTSRGGISSVLPRLPSDVVRPQPAWKPLAGC